MNGTVSSMPEKENDHGKANIDRNDSNLTVVEENGETISLAEEPPTKNEAGSLGWRGCCFTNMLPFSLWYSMVNITTSALTTYLTSQITTLEKQFGLSSSESGLLQSMNDAGFLVIVLFISYFGRHSHIPRILGACGLLFGFSALLCIVPHFTRSASNGLPEVTTNTSVNFSTREEDLLCSDVIHNPEESKCSAEERDFYSSSKTVAMIIISSGMFIQGMAKSPRQPLSQTYIDDNVPPTKSGFYIGIMLSTIVFGPAISFGLGGLVSDIYVTLEETDMTPRDPRWVGAWWIGFLVFGFLAIVFSFPLFLFPKRLTNAPTNRTVSTKVTKNKKTGKRIIAEVKDVLRSLLRLMKNPVFICMVAAYGIRVFTVSGIASFMPKYMQIHYGLTVLKANIIAGVVAVLAAAAGAFLGGLITRKWELHLTQMLKIVLGTQLIASLLYLVGMFLNCPQPEILGFPPETNQSDQSVLLAADTFPFCYAECNCNGADYFPVCGSNGLNYFSPCHAGCETRIAKGYGNCSCIANSTAGVPTLTVDATPGLCKSECGLYIPFIVLMFLWAFVSGIGSVPGTMALIRSVDEEDKSLAIGVNAFVSSLLGWFLGPVVIGSVIDSTCLMWETSCSKEGSCAVYDIADLRYKLHGVDAGVSLVYSIIYAMAFMFAGKYRKGKLDITRSASIRIEADKDIQENEELNDVHQEVMGESRIINSVPE